MRLKIIARVAEHNAYVQEYQHRLQQVGEELFRVFPGVDSTAIVRAAQIIVASIMEDWEHENPVD